MKIITNTENQDSSSRYSNNIYDQIIYLAANKKQAKQKAIKSANQTKTKVFQMLNILAKDKDPNVRKTVAEVAYLDGDLPETIRLLEKMIKDRNTKVRKEVAITLIKINHPETARLLKKLEKDKSYDVQKILTKYANWKKQQKANAALEKMVKNKNQKALKKLKKNIKDKDRNIRIEAAILLGEIRLPEALNLLEKIIKGSECDPKTENNYASSSSRGDTRIKPLLSVMVIYKNAMVFLNYLGVKKEQGEESNTIKESFVEHLNDQFRYYYDNKGYPDLESNFYFQKIQYADDKKKRRNRL